MEKWYGNVHAKILNARNNNKMLPKYILEIKNVTIKNPGKVSRNIFNNHKAPDKSTIDKKKIHIIQN